MNLIGCGGTGSAMLMALARINRSLISLGHAGLQVFAYDHDSIEAPNLGRQLFTDSELGLNKAVALVTRANRAFGSRWQAIPKKFTERETPRQLTVSCVDTVETRFMIGKCLSRNKPVLSGQIDIPIYWLDCGNDKFTGQVILGTIGKIKQPSSKMFLPIGCLPIITDEYNELLNSADIKSDTPSCSLAEALENQDLFINTSIAGIAASLIWNIFRKGILKYRGFFLNLEDFKMQPIPI